MKSIASVIIVMMSALLVSGVQAEIYSWTDENGVKHYSHTPPPERSVPVEIAPEIRSDPEALQQQEKINETNVEAILKELEQEEAASPPKNPPQPKNRLPAGRVSMRKRKNCRKRSPGWNNWHRKRMPMRAANRPSSAAIDTG